MKLKYFDPQKISGLRKKKLLGEIAEGRFNRKQQWDVERSCELRLIFAWAALTWRKDLIWPAHFFIQWLIMDENLFFHQWIVSTSPPVIYSNINTHIPPPPCFTKLNVEYRETCVILRENALLFFRSYLKGKQVYDKQKDSWIVFMMTIVLLTLTLWFFKRIVHYFHI